MVIARETALGGMGPRLRAGAVHGAVALWRERVDRFIDIVRAVENTPRGGEWTMEWTHRARGQRGIPGRYGARDLSAAASRGPGAPTAVGVAGSVPRSGLRRTSNLYVSTGPVGA